MCSITLRPFDAREGGRTQRFSERRSVPGANHQRRRDKYDEIVAAPRASATEAAAACRRALVLGAAAPIAGSSVTLWAAGPSGPTELAQTQSGADGRFEFSADNRGGDLYIVAAGGRPAANAAGGDNLAIALIAVLGPNAPENVVVNQMTTIASVFTHNQFIDRTGIKGPALSLRIAAGNVPNFVNLATGGWGDAILGPLNSSQTPTLANFATLADALAGCVARVAEDACAKLFVAATPPTGSVPTDTPTAAEAIARYPCRPCENCRNSV
jgi:hypothetical protein